MTEYPASRLTTMTLHWLRERHPDALLTTELSVETWGQASLDVAAVTSTEIIGVEIKGSGDSASHLERQGWIYSRAATRMWLLTVPSLEKAAAKKLPPDWYRLVIDQTSGGIGMPNDTKLKNIDRCVEPPRLPNSARILAGMLWANEARVFARLEGVEVVGRTYQHNVASAIAEQVPLSRIRAGVCDALLNRDWRHPRIDKVVYYPGDKLPAIDREAA